MAGPGTGCLAHPILEHHDKEVEELLKFAQDPIKRPGRSTEWKKKKDFCKVWTTSNVWVNYSVGYPNFRSQPELAKVILPPFSGTSRSLDWIQGIL